MEPISFLLTILIIISVVLYVWAVYDLIKHRSDFKKKIHQGLWLMIVVFLPILGSLTYLSVRRSIR
jgi:hypothetical protein